MTQLALQRYYHELCRVTIDEVIVGQISFSGGGKIRWRLSFILFTVRQNTPQKLVVLEITCKMSPKQDL